MDAAKAQQFAQDWINAWNAHDIDAILHHYAENLSFYSPLVSGLQFNDAGIITNKADLKAYFEIGLNRFPDLHFQYHNCFAGINTVVIYYTSVNNRLAVEVFELNDAGKAVKVYCNYGTA